METILNSPVLRVYDLGFRVQRPVTEYPGGYVKGFAYLDYKSIPTVTGLGAVLKV